MYLAKTENLHKLSNAARFTVNWCNAHSYKTSMHVASSLKNNLENFPKPIT